MIMMLARAHDHDVKPDQHIVYVFGHDRERVSSSMIITYLE